MINTKGQMGGVANDRVHSARRSSVTPTTGQMGGVAFAIFFVIAMGFVLYQFTPAIDTLRISLLSSIDNEKVLLKLFLYNLLPILWFGWLVISLFTVIGTARASSG